MEGNGKALLVGGSSDAGGAWAYGILEVLFNNVYAIINDPVFGGGLGRRGAPVACRSLGYTTGAQFLAGQSSPLPAPKKTPPLLASIICSGSEASLAECNILTPAENSRSDGFFANIDVATGTVVLICASPSGPLNSHAVQHSLSLMHGLPISGWKVVVIHIRCLKAAAAGSLDH